MFFFVSHLAICLIYRKVCALFCVFARLEFIETLVICSLASLWSLFHITI